MKQNLILIGMSGAGKTTIARLLARKIGYMSLDSDELISFEQGQSVEEIINFYTIEAFRRKERECIGRAIDYVDVVISAGGGVVEQQQLMQQVTQKCCCIYLYASPLALFRRLKKDAPRPLLVPLTQQSVTALYDKRKHLYLQYADIVVDTTNKSPSLVVNDIIERLNKLFA